MSSPATEPLIERPLHGAGKIGLALGAAGFIFLFYLFVLLSIVGLSALLLVEVVLVLALARFGLGGAMARVASAHVAPLPVFFRSLWVRKDTEFRIAITQEDAPGLFNVLTQLCDRVQVRVPESVALEMATNAWVKLRGYRRGAGKTTLGLGYDLLAGLSNGEIEAVLAHEMMHAKLQQRGFTRVLRSGLNRAIKLAGGLSGQAESARRSRKVASLTEYFLGGADWLARNCARMVAACSRQEEFAADVGATKVCGPGMLQSALLRLRQIDRHAARLPWSERVAQLHFGPGFGDWLAKELRAPGPAPAPEVKAELRSKYSTHPSLHDRLAALPAIPMPAAGLEGTSLNLLADPDKLAEKLIAEIQRLVVAQEERDSKVLERWNKRLRAHSHLRTFQSLGIFAAALGIIVGGLWWVTTGVSSELLIFAGVTIVPGILLYKLGGYRERISLPVPDFAVLAAKGESTSLYDDGKAKEIEMELTHSIPARMGSRKKARCFVEAAYGALGKCDYFRAYVAAGLALGFNSRSVEGAGAKAIAAAALQKTADMQSAFRALELSTRFRGPSASWAAAWVFLFCGQWDRAEGMLQYARKSRPDEPTLLALQALCQARRGKLQSAIVSARQACGPVPRNKEYARQLINLLLDGGLVREAEERFVQLGDSVRTDPELVFSMLRCRLMARKFDEAAEWEDVHLKNSNGAHGLVRLGALYEASRNQEKAAACFKQALEVNHFPEARLGLARLEAARENRRLAEEHLLAALDLQKTPGPNGAGPLQILAPALAQLMMLEEPILNCRTWMITLNAAKGPAPLAHHSFLIHATSENEAEARFSKLLSALEPGKPPPAPATLGVWRHLPKEQQPDGPCRPGVLLANLH